MNSQADRRYNWVIQGILALLFLLTPVVYFKYTTKMFYIPKDMFVQILVLTATTLWAVKMIRAGDVKLSRSPLILPVSLYLGIMTVSIYFSYRMYLALTDWLRFVNYILVFYLILHCVRNFSRQRFLIRMVLTSGIICALYGIMQNFGMEFIFAVNPSGRLKVFSFFGNPNFLAGFLVTMLPLALGEIAGGLVDAIMSTRSKGGFFRFSLGCMAFLLSFLCILPTQTRGAWLSFAGSSFCFAVMFLFFVIPELRKKVPSLRTGNLLVVALVVMMVVGLVAEVFYHNQVKAYYHRFKSIANPEERNIKQRLLMWQCTWDMMKDHPVIGVGVGNFKYLYFRYQGMFFEKPGTEKYRETAVSPIRAHNEYLQTGAEMGFLGLLSFLGVIVTALWMVGKLLYTLESPSKRVFYASLVATNLGILSHAMVSFPFHRPTIAIIFWAALGMCAAAYEEVCMKPESKQTAPANGEERVEIPPGLRVGSQMMVVAAVLVALFMLIRLFIANAYIRLGLGYQVSKNMPELIKQQGTENSFRRSIEIDPNNGEAYFRLAEMLRVQKKHEEAISAYKKSLEQLQSRFSYYQLGGLHEAIGLKEEAEEYYRELIRYMPNFFQAHYSLARMLVNQERLDEAIYHLEQGLIYDNKKRQEVTRYSLARLCFQVKRYKDCILRVKEIQILHRKGKWDEKTVPMRLIDQLLIYAENNIRILEERGEEGPVLEIELE
ncbi:MAG: O-antigen ligase family protein [bacterium]|nr:O-antigen ligase family protein [bacterium]